MSASGRTADLSSPHFMSTLSSSQRLFPTLYNASDRARLQNAGDRQSAFSCAPDNIHWPCAACTEGIRPARISDVCACGSWLLEPVPRQAERQPRLVCIGLLWADAMNDCLRRFSRKVIVGLAQAFANVVGKPAIFVRHFGQHIEPPAESYDGSLTLPT